MPFMGVSNRKGCGVTVKDVPAHEFVAAYAKHLKAQGKLVMPAFTEYCKSGVGKEIAPLNPDWYYIRAASIARHIYIRPAGVNRLRRVYGNAKNVGVRPAAVVRASGSIIRHILQSLEEMKIVRKDENGGRHLTSEGRKELDEIAISVVKDIKNKPIVC